MSFSTNLKTWIFDETRFSKISLTRFLSKINERHFHIPRYYINTITKKKKHFFTESDKLVLHKCIYSTNILDWANTYHVFDDFCPKISFIFFWIFFLAVRSRPVSAASGSNKNNTFHLLKHSFRSDAHRLFWKITKANWKTNFIDLLRSFNVTYS